MKILNIILMLMLSFSTVASQYDYKSVPKTTKELQVLQCWDRVYLLEAIIKMRNARKNKGKKFDKITDKYEILLDNLTVKCQLLESETEEKVK